ncbi:MAG: hypothetical protein ABI700_20720 [Chloroflexota bacterium]
MSRLAKLLIIAVLLIGVGSVLAQDATLPPPSGDQSSQAFPTLPPAASPTPIPPELLALTPTVPPTEAVVQTLEVTAAPQGTPTPTPIPLGVEQSEALPILINARADLELLANTAIGSAQRPIGWSGSIDVSDPQLPLWIRLDLENLTGAIMGADQRPAGWFGVVPSIPLAVARDIRHDLELLADTVIGAAGIRPAGWKGDDPMYRCDRATQALFTLLKSRGISVTVDFTKANYCEVATLAASRYVERQILQPPPAVSANTTTTSNQLRYPFQADNPFVVAFLDRKARHKIGVLPPGTGFQPLARSYVGFSNMMLVQGDNFAVFVDYTTTTVSEEEFSLLPDITGEGSTSCEAVWCGKGLD